jgi:hypothetical protein
VDQGAAGINGSAGNKRRGVGSGSGGIYRYVSSREDVFNTRRS